MNYYNPYFYTIPNTMISTAPKTGLFSKIFGGKVTFGSIINGTQKTLNFINQAIPVVKQATPIVKNAKTMFRVMNEFKKSDVSKINTTINNKSNTNNSINNTNNLSIENNVETTNQGPTFFI